MRRPRKPRQMRFVVPILSLLSLALATGRAEAQCGPDPDALERAMQATLVVAAADRDRRFLGSAVLWRDGRFAVTAAHVVGERRKVRLRNAYGFEVMAEVVILDGARDVAFVKLAEAVMGEGLAPRLTALRVGEPVYAIGAPFEADQTVTAGIISSRGRQVDPAIPVFLVQHDAAINAGSSGGALVDAQGRLIGINAELAEASRFYVGLSYALPVQLLADVQDGTLNDIPVLGLRLRPVDGMIAEALGIEEGQGLLVDYVMPGGAADSAGIRAGDVILAIDGTPIRREGDFALLIDARTEARNSATLLRKGARIEVVLSYEVSDSGMISAGAHRLAPALAPVARCTSMKELGVVIKGRRVTGIVPTSPAYLAGLSVGDEILTIDGIPVAERGFVWPEIDGPVVLLVRAPGGQTRHVVFDPFSNEQRMRPISGAVVLDPAVITL
ncbi:MAG: PDZ domain-containing protein [Rhodobacteraceae bacterium]|nr:MAG: PDZ domain-containing protein [Paracoccaceae bacterium]